MVAIGTCAFAGFHQHRQGAGGTCRFYVNDVVADKGHAAKIHAKMRRLIEQRQTETIEILRGW